MEGSSAGAVTVRPFRSGDLPRLLLDAGPRDRLHHRERSRMHERGEATYLLAWNGDLPCGRVTVLRRSKYEQVRTTAGDFPELNALEVAPRGRGIGSRLIASAEEQVLMQGASRMGLAVEHGNVAARRLYVRLGYLEWAHGDVVDRWEERDGAGRAVRQHADPCSYLVKDLTGRAT